MSFCLFSLPTPDSALFYLGMAKIGPDDACESSTDPSKYRCSRSGYSSQRESYDSQRRKSSRAEDDSFQRRKSTGPESSRRKKSVDPTKSQKLRIELGRLSMHDQVAQDETKLAADHELESKLYAAVRTSPMLVSIRRAAPQKLMDNTERVAIAGIFAQHAAARTNVGMVNWASPRARHIYRVRHALLYRIALYAAFLGLLIVVIWEPPSSSALPAVVNWTAIDWASFSASTAVEVCSALVFAVDVVLQVICCTPRVFCSSKANLVFALLVLCILSDAIATPIIVHAASVCPLRVSRVLRPLLLPFLSQTVSHMVISIAYTIPSLADLGLCMITVIIFYGLLSASLFAPYDANDSPAPLEPPTLPPIPVPSSPPTLPPAMPLTATPLAPPSPSFPLPLVAHQASSYATVSEPLQELHTTLLALCILLFTADNYPMIMWESFSCKGVGCYVGVGTALFASFVIIGHVVLMSIFIAGMCSVHSHMHIVCSHRTLSCAWHASSHTQCRRALISCSHLLPSSLDLICCGTGSALRCL